MPLPLIEETREAVRMKRKQERYHRLMDDLMRGDGDYGVGIDGTMPSSNLGYKFHRRTMEAYLNRLWRDAFGALAESAEKVQLRQEHERNLEAIFSD